MPTATHEHADGRGQERHQRRAAWLTPVATLALALALDRLGEPPNRLHPVVGLGWLIAHLERRAPAHPAAQLAYGAGLALLVPSVAALVAALVGRLTRRWPLADVLIGGALLKTLFADHALRAAVRAVHAPLAAGDLPRARLALRALVSRERAHLDAGQCAAAAIESAAENLGDSVVAPLLAYALGGLPAAAAYRAANTADSMIGFHGRYEHLGKAAARLDDLLNLLPARLAALLLVAAAGPRRAAAWRVARRDHGLTESPNAGWPMAAAAGALGVALEKVDHYTLNPGARRPVAADIPPALALTRRAARGGMALALALTLLRALRWRRP